MDDTCPCECCDKDCDVWESQYCCELCEWSLGSHDPESYCDNCDSSDI